MTPTLRPPVIPSPEHREVFRSWMSGHTRSIYDAGIAWAQTGAALARDETKGRARR